MNRFAKWLVRVAIAGIVTLPAAAQVLLPNGQQQFVDANGAPLAGGKVYFYIPQTTTAKATYQDQGQTVPNTNPVVLNAAGRAIIWGEGLYREVLYDQYGNLVWDQITGETTSNGPGGGAPLGGFGAQTGIASASTTTLSNVESHNALVTGSVSIASFGTGASIDAPVYLVEFSDSLTLTYDAVALQLPGAADIVTVAGDVALVEYLGSGNWKVAEYYRASGAPLISNFSLHQQVFTSSGTFTVPSGINAATLFEFDVQGGGGGAVVASTGDLAAGGGAGAYGVKTASGFSVGDTVAVTVGTGGTGGSNADGNAGTASSVNVQSTVYTAGGGGGGSYFGVPAPGTGGTTSGTFDLSSTGGTGSGGIISYLTGVQSVTVSGGASFFGNGGYGAGGKASTTTSAGTTGNGQNGVVIVKWAQ